MNELVMYFDLKTGKDLGLQLVDISDSRWRDEFPRLLTSRGIGYYVYYKD